MFRRAAFVAALSALSCPGWAGIYDLPEDAPRPKKTRARFGQDKLIAAGGASQIEGAGGGGLVPWALLTGGGTRDRVGASAFYTATAFNDYRLNAAGAALSFWDRLEISFAAQSFQLTGAVFPGNTIKQQVAGAKLRLFGDAVFGQDSVWPQVALGVQHKRNQDFAFVPKAVGARGASGTDAYLAASKLFLAGLAGRNLLLNAAVRATRANQLGLLGFGGDRSNAYRPCFEGSAALFLNEQTALGVEYRQKPDNLSAFKEEGWGDAFITYFPNKNLSLTAAYVRLGRVAGRDQSGPYLSFQASL